MSTATVEHISRILQAGLCPLKCEKARRIGLSTGIGTHIQETYIVSKIAFC